MSEVFDVSDGGPFRFPPTNKQIGNVLPDFQENEYPLDVWPENVRQMIQDTAKCTQTPETLGGAFAAGILSGCIGQGLVISDAAFGNDGLPVLQIMVFMPSGGGKSSVMRKFAKPLHKWTSQMKKEHQIKESEIRGREKCLEAELEKILIDHKKSPSEKHQIRVAELQCEIDVLRRQKTSTTYVTEDATEERLAVLLGRNGETGAEAIFSLSVDARKPLTTLMGRYSNGTIGSGPYLNGFSGDTCFVHRQNLDRSVELKSPFVSLLWVMQPDLATKLLENDELKNSGFIPRQIMERCHKTRVSTLFQIKESPEASKGWDALIFDVLEKFRVLSEPIRIDAPPQARELIQNYFNEVQARVNSGELADIDSDASRWAEQAWRFALNLHVARHGKLAGNFPLEVISATNGIRLARYYESRKLQLLIPSRERVEQKRREKVFDLAKRLGYVNPSRCAQYLHEYDSAEWRNWLERNREYFELILVKAKGGGRTSEQYYLKDQKDSSYASHARNARIARNEEVFGLSNADSCGVPSIVSVPSMDSNPSTAILNS